MKAATMTRTWIEEAEAALDAAAADLSGRERLGWERDVPLSSRPTQAFNPAASGARPNSA